MAQIAGEQIAAAEFVARGGLIAPVAEKHHRIGAGNRNVADRAVRHGLTVVVDNLHLVARHRLADGADLRREQRRTRRHHDVALGLPIELVDGHAERGASPCDQFFAERFATACHRVQR